MQSSHRYFRVVFVYIDNVAVNLCRSLKEVAEYNVKLQHLLASNAV
ncbi:hypothetical protein EWP19_06425 [Acinetobacter piscicola]|nr:hypothetical protein EWP19_06425 [Acinetobacter piscicola]